MSRLNCLDGTQKKLLENILMRYPNIREMAKIARVHSRTIRDWRREKYRMSYEILKRLYDEKGLGLPSLRVLPDFWQVKRAAQLGGRRRYELYGPLGSPESQRKGGLISAQQFLNNPLYRRATGFKFRKPIRYPKKSAHLAEFVGILLGDGCLSSGYQIGISFNSGTDKIYGLYLSRLFKKLFGVSGVIYYRPRTNAGVVTASSRALHEYL